MTDLIERPADEVAPPKGATGRRLGEAAQGAAAGRCPCRTCRPSPPRRASRSGATSRAASTTARRAARTRRSSSARTSRSRTRTPSRSSRPRRRSGRRRRRASGSRSTAASSRASRARRSSRSAATTGSRSRRCATSRSCPASGRAGCASSTSRARSTRRSRARGTCDDGMVVQTQTEEIRRLRRTNLELIFSDHNAYCLPPCQNKCPSHIDIPGFLKQNAEGNFRESTRIFKRTIPFPSVLGRVCPAPCEEHCRRDEVDEAIAIRDSHRYAGDMVIKSMLDDDLDPPIPFEQQPATGRRAAVIGSGPGGHGRGLLPAPLGPRRHRLRARPGAGRDAPLRHPAVPPAEGRGPRGRVREHHPPRREGRLQPGPRPRLHARRPAVPGLRRDRHRDRLLRHEQAGHPRRGRARGPRRPRVPAHRDARPALPEPRGQARRRHRRRVHLDGLLADLDPPGREGGHPRLPPRHEGHARVERGPRGDRGGRDRHLPGRPRPGRHGQGQQRHRRRVHPDGPRRARCLRPPPPRARARHRVHDPVRPGAARDRPGTGARLDRPGLHRPRRHEEQAPPGRRRHVRDRPRPACSGPATSGSAPRRSSRRSPRAAARPTRSTRSCAATTSRPSAPARPSPSPSRSSCRSCRSPRRSRSRATGSRPSRRRSASTATSSTSSRTRARRSSASRRAASSARARRSGSATCAASASSTRRR